MAATTPLDANLDCTALHDEVLKIGAIKAAAAKEKAQSNVSRGALTAVGAAAGDPLGAVLNGSFTASAARRYQKSIQAADRRLAVLAQLQRAGDCIPPSEALNH